MWIPPPSAVRVVHDHYQQAAPLGPLRTGLWKSFSSARGRRRKRVIMFSRRSKRTCSTCVAARGKERGRLLPAERGISLSACVVEGGGWVGGWREGRQRESKPRCVGGGGAGAPPPPAT